MSDSLSFRNSEIQVPQCGEMKSKNVGRLLVLNWSDVTLPLWVIRLKVGSTSKLVRVEVDFWLQETAVKTRVSRKMKSMESWIGRERFICLPYNICLRGSHICLLNYIFIIEDALFMIVLLSRMLFSMNWAEGCWLLVVKKSAIVVPKISDCFLFLKCYPDSRKVWNHYVAVFNY